MAVRVTPAGNQTFGGFAPSSFANGIAGGWIGYNERTASQTITLAAGETDLTSLSVAVTVNASRRVRITGFIPAIEVTVVDARFILRIAEGGTTLAESVVCVGRTGASMAHAICIAVETPSTGSHTYRLTGTYDSAGSGSVVLNSSSTAVAFILCEDIGPAS